MTNQARMVIHDIIYESFGALWTRMVGIDELERSWCMAGEDSIG